MVSRDSARAVGGASVLFALDASTTAHPVSTSCLLNDRRYGVNRARAARGRLALTVQEEIPSELQSSRATRRPFPPSVSCRAGEGKQSLLAYFDSGFGAGGGGAGFTG